MDNYDEGSMLAQELDAALLRVQALEEKVEALLELHGGQGNVELRNLYPTLHRTHVDWD